MINNLFSSSEKLIQEFETDFFIKTILPFYPHESEFTEILGDWVYRSGTFRKDFAIMDDKRFPEFYRYINGIEFENNLRDLTNVDCELRIGAVLNHTYTKNGRAPGLMPHVDVYSKIATIIVNLGDLDSYTGGRTCWHNHDDIPEYHKKMVYQCREDPNVVKNIWEDYRDNTTEIYNIKPIFEMNELPIIFFNGDTSWHSVSEMYSNTDDECVRKILTITVNNASYDYHKFENKK